MKGILKKAADVKRTIDSSAQNLHEAICLILIGRVALVCRFAGAVSVLSCVFNCAKDMIS